MKGFEGGGDYEMLLYGDVPSKMLRSKEKGCGNVGLNEIGDFASANVSVSVRLNVSESGILELGNGSVID